MFVEAHTVGQDDWTALPDANGKTSSDTGDSCPEGLALGAPAARALPGCGLLRLQRGDRR